MYLHFLNSTDCVVSVDFPEASFTPVEIVAPVETINAHFPGPL